MLPVGVTSIVSKWCRGEARNARGPPPLRRSHAPHRGRRKEGVFAVVSTGLNICRRPGGCNEARISNPHDAYVPRVFWRRLRTRCACLAPPTSPSPPSPTQDASAWVWAMVVGEDGSGLCILDATVEVVAGQGLGQRATQSEPCDIWWVGGVDFRKLTPRRGDDTACICIGLHSGGENGHSHNRGADGYDFFAAQKPSTVTDSILSTAIELR